MLTKYKILLLLFAGAFASCEKKTNTDAIAPPIADKIPYELNDRGKRVDDYFWMRLSDEQKNAAVKDSATEKVIAYLNAENDYLKAKMKHTEALQEKIYNEIVGRIKQTDESVPYKRNGYWYYTRYEENQEYPIYCRKKDTLENPEEILLNVNNLAKGYSYYSVGGISVSDDNKLLAYTVDTVSRRQYTLY
jgi:oligopeptidase B